MLAHEVLGESGLAFAALAIQDPKDGSVVCFLFEAFHELFLPWSGDEGGVPAGLLESLPETCDLWPMEHEGFGIFGGNVMVGSALLYCLHEPIQVRSVALSSGIEMSHLDRFRHLCVLLSAVIPALFAAASRCFDVCSSEAGDAVLDAGNAHALVELTVALDVNAACVSAALSLGNAISCGGKICGEVIEEI